MSFSIMLMFETIPALIGVMYACVNIGDYTDPTITKFISLFCIPFLSMQCFVWMIPAGLLYMAGYPLFCCACIAWIILSFFIVGTIENRMVNWY